MIGPGWILEFDERGKTYELEITKTGLIKLLQVEQINKVGAAVYQRIELEVIETGLPFTQDPEVFLSMDQLAVINRQDYVTQEIYQLQYFKPKLVEWSKVK